ncbi:MAG: type IV secretory system conjugative DNA transfer family protein [Acidimicrobiales bacterium]
MSRPRTTAAPVPTPWPGLYLGAGPFGPVCAGPERAALILGPPRSGKTSCVIAPIVLCAPGAVVATSTKTDLLHITARARSRRGRIWLFDPSATTSLPEGVEQLCWSPVTGCADWDIAVSTAHALVGAARPAAGIEHATHWVERAEALLAPLMHAADLLDKDISWVIRWVQQHDLTEPLGILAHRAGELAANSLISIAHSEERERSAIFSTTSGVLAAYRSAAALHQATKPTFDPVAFAVSHDAVYICSPAHHQDQLAPIVVALLDRIRTHIYRRPPGLAPVVWALDEAANIAPIPNLAAVVSEGGGQGLLTVCCLQDLSQARQRWGAAADGFWSLFAAKVLLPGIGELQTLRTVSALAGEHDVPHTSTSRPTGWFWWRHGRVTQTTTTQRRPVLTVDQIARGHPGMALAVLGPQPPTWIRLTPWWTDPFHRLTQGAS